MANRTFQEDWFAIPKRMASIFGIFSVSGTTPSLQRWIYRSLQAGNAGTYTAAPTTGGGTGFPNRYQQGTEGIFSVARTGVGLWTITLQDQYQRVMNVTGSQVIAGGAANIIAFAENSSITNMSAAGGSVVGVSLLSATATLADPTSGSIIRLQIDLNDATEP